MKKKREMKKTARKALKANYWRCVAISFLVAVLLGNLKMNVPYTFHSNISNHIQISSPINLEIVTETFEKITNVKTKIENYKPTKGILANVFNNITASGNIFFGLLNSFNQLIFHERIWASLIIFWGTVLAFLYWYFIANTIKVGNARFFLENRNYKETNFKRLLLPYHIKEGKNNRKTMFIRTLKEILWTFTIVGFFIKYYAYALVPYILAENPKISSKDAIELSENMMKNNKWELFKLDLSFIGWQILDLLSFHLIGIIYLNPYRNSAKAEFYMQVRNLAKQEKIKNSNFLKDNLLEENGNQYPKEKYLYEETTHKWINTDYNRNYSISSLILMFFTACIIGWIWEVSFNLFQYGNFVNRGTLYGPWLPIYGWGAILLLIVLKKTRNKPILTFILALLICGIIEYSTGLFLELTKNMRYWEYDGYFLNINGRVCLEGLLLFGMGGCLFIYFIAPFLDSLYTKIKPQIKNILCIILTILFIIDNVWATIHPNAGEGVAESVPIKENK